MLVAGSALLVVLILYVLFAGFLPAKQRVGRLEAELKEVYAREAALQTKLQQMELKRDQQMSSLAAERAALARRLEEVQRELAAAKKKR